MSILKFSPITFAIVLAIVQSALAQSWSQTGAPIANWFSIASSGDGNNLVAVTQGDQTNQGSWFTTLPGAIYTSTNSGLSWNLSDGPSDVWQSVASSYDGNELAAVPEYGGLYISTNAGQSWSEATNAPVAFWGNIAISANGLTIAATIPGAEAVPGGILMSLDAGITWQQTTAPTDQDWASIALSGDGKKLIAGAIDGGVFLSTNSGTTWFRASMTDGIWESVAVSSNGQMFVACGSSGFGPQSIFISTNSASTWSQSSVPVASWQTVATSADGSRIVAANGYGQIYTSPDSGVTWHQNDAPSVGWFALASSSDGAKLVAVVNGGGIYIPMLGITGSSGEIALSWPSNSFNFQLQQSYDLTATNWTAITNVPVLNLTNLQYGLTLPSTNHNCFYRVQQSQAAH
jgi:hypothetical protein